MFTNGENLQDKTPLDKFKIITLENPLLSITSSYKYVESYQTLWPINVQHSQKLFYIKYYKIIRVLHGQLTNYYTNNNTTK